MPDDKHHLLICTIGGTPDPIVKCLCQWKPTRVLFIPSEQTRTLVDSVLHGFAEAVGWPLSPGQYVVKPVFDAEDFTGCVKTIHTLDNEVSDWLSRQGGEYRVIVDFTAGTKCMTAALALVAHRWDCDYSYVGGQQRTKEGIGIVESGSERVVHSANPWNALGYQAIEDACLLFDQCAFTPAVKLLDQARKAADDEAVKRTLSTFQQLCEGYGLWDRFQHNDAAKRLANVLKNAADIQAALGSSRSEAVIRAVKQHHENLERLVAYPQSRAMVADLLANARRRRNEGRFDDGVARLYRAIEALAQLVLAERHEISGTDSVPLHRIPESLRGRWEQHAENGKVMLGLQDAYAVLHELGDETGKTFKSLYLDDPQRSPLTARNQSILAHGFQPVGEEIFTQMWNAAMEVGNFQEKELSPFPMLANQVISI